MTDFDGAIAAIREIEARFGVRVASDGCGCCGDGGAFVLFSKAEKGGYRTVYTPDEVSA